MTTRNSVFLHEARLGQCRAIIGQRDWRLRQSHAGQPLAIICAAPVTGKGAHWCAAHAARYTVPSPFRPAAPREAMRIDRPPAEEMPEPDLCALVMGAA